MGLGESLPRGYNGILSELERARQSLSWLFNEHNSNRLLEEENMNDSKSNLIRQSGVAMLRLFGVGAVAFLGAWLAIGLAARPEAANTEPVPIVLNADTANSGKAISLATGVVDENVEGLFVLDHLSGNLQCWVINPKTGGVAAIFAASPVVDMGLDKGGDTDFVMCTGGVNFTGRGRTGNARPANVICYVADGNSGKVVGYSLVFDRQAAIRGDTQGGLLEVVCRGFARDAGAIRDQ